MKVVFLARWYPYKYDPMFGLFVQRHAEAAALFNEVSAIYVHPNPNASQTYEMDRRNENGVDTIRVYYKKRGKISSPFRYFMACRKALRLVGKADLIHVHVLTRMGVVAWWQKALHGTPYIITEHWSRYLPGNNFSGFLRKALTRKVVRHAEMVTTVTENLAMAMQGHRLLNPHYEILPNVIDTNLFQPQPHCNEVPRIIHISCFEDKSKNISGLLQALSILRNRGVSYEAVLIGEGMDYEAMRALSERLNLQPRVRFTGLLQGKALVDELAQGDFLVLSSHYENLPVVILEALACGLPVVSTRVGGIAEILNESNGILVPPDDTPALAEAMERCCHTYHDYDSNSLRASVVERNCYESVGHLLTQWYHQAIKKG